MEMEDVSNSAAALLCEFLRAGDEIGSERSLALLFSNHAEPQVRRMLRRKMSAMGVVERQDLDDLCSHVLLDLLRYLRRLQANPEQKRIEDFPAYTSVTVYRAYSDYLRSKYPRRHRLKAHLRHLLRADPRFHLEKTTRNEWICSLSRSPSTATVANIQDLRTEFHDLPRGVRPPNAAEFVSAVLERIAVGVELDDLVGWIAELWGVRDSPNADLDEVGNVSAPRPENDVIDTRKRLERLWDQVCTLPLRQRHALLLNLRDGKRGSALTLLPAIGIASVLGISAVLEIPNDELRSIWNELPLDDNQIARRLGVARQQVINLRKSARARLMRREQKA
jgi:hypothetical protein